MTTPGGVERPPRTQELDIYCERYIRMTAGFSKDKIDTNLRCKKHPKYMALRKPTADCQPCRDMFADAEKSRRVRR